MPFAAGELPNVFLTESWSIHLPNHYGKRLADFGATPSFGTAGDSYNNALAETVIGLHKTELIRGPGQPSPLPNRSTSPWLESNTRASTDPGAGQRSVT